MDRGKNISLALVLTFALIVVVANAGSVPSQVIDICASIGARSGCSGCQIGSRGLCEWCVDPLDTSGQNREEGAKLPKCIPHGHCSDVGQGLQRMTNDLCPPLNKTEPLYGGPVAKKKQSTVLSSAHDTMYCQFDVEPYIVDRSTFAAADLCNKVNRHANAGLSMDLGLLSKSCFDSQTTPLTQAQKFCLEVAQSFACTYNCPKYGEPFTGYKKSSCRRFRTACAKWTHIEGCPLNAMASTLDELCIDDDVALGSTINRLVPTSRWALDYGLNAKTITIPRDDNFGGSKILVTQSLIDTLTGWKPGFFVMCFQYSRDLEDAAKFHANCNGKGPTYTVIKSPQGNIFGGWAPASFTGTGGFVINPDAFLFTLKNPNDIPPTKFPVKPGDYAFYDNSAAGPNFGGGFDIGTWGYPDGRRWDWGFNMWSYNYGAYYAEYYHDPTSLGGVLFNGPGIFQSELSPWNYDTYRMTPATGELEVFYLST